MRNKNYRPPASPPLSDDDNNSASAEDAGRFTDTRDLLAYGVKLGLGKATQEQAIRQLQQRFPEQAELFRNPMFLAGIKMALPLVGIQLAQQLSSAALSEKLRDASQGMLLINTIDTTADVTQAAGAQLVELGRFVLGLYGISGDEADESARQLVADLTGAGAHQPLRAAAASGRPR